MKNSAIASLATGVLMLCGSALGQAPKVPPKRLNRSAARAKPPPDRWQGHRGDQSVTYGAPTANRLLPDAASEPEGRCQRCDDADSDRSDDWILHGRTYDNQRFSFSPTSTSPTSASFAPRHHPTHHQDTEMTPIEVDGVLYLETGDNNIQAYDAITGKQLWAYSPKLGYANLCCGQQARGVAVAYGRVFAHN